MKSSEGANWLGKLASLNVARTPGPGIAPHKPLMLLSPCDLIESREIADRLIACTPRLVTEFRDCRDLVIARRRNRPDIMMRFRHPARFSLVGQRRDGGITWRATGVLIATTSTGTPFGEIVHTLAPLHWRRHFFKPGDDGESLARWCWRRNSHFPKFAKSAVRSETQGVIPLIHGSQSRCLSPVHTCRVAECSPVAPHLR